MTDSKSEDLSQNITLLIDETYHERSTITDNANFAAVCIVCIQGKYNYELLLDQLRKISLDPAVNTYGVSSYFHFNDVSISSRQSLVPWIAEMPISVYLAATKKFISDSKQEKDTFVYNSLFPTILEPIQSKFYNRFGNKVKFELKFENLTDKINNDAKFFRNILGKSKRFQNMSSRVVTKTQEPLLFLPDYFLGFTRSHIMEKNNGTWHTESLRLLSEKIGLLAIIDHKIIHFERGKEIRDFLN